MTNRYKPRKMLMSLKKRLFFRFDVLSLVLIFAATASPQSALPTINSSDNNPIAQGQSNCFRGTGFGASQGSSTVAINGTAVTPTTWQDTSVCFILPASTPPGAATGQVTTGLGASNVLYFTATGQPTISSLTPSSGTAGTQVTVTGTNFGVTKYSNNRSYIRWNGTDLPLVSWSDTQIVVEIPTGLTPGSASIVVVDNGLSASTSNFSVLALPTINSSDNNPIAQGMVNCFQGTGFGASQGSSTVTINGTTVTPTAWQDTSVCFILPASTPPGAATGRVTTSLGASNLLYFTATGQPTISSLTPSSGVAGTQVTVTGTNFGVTKYSNNRSYIRWNGTDLPLVSWGDTQIVVEIPTGLTPGIASIVVVDNGLSASTSNFTVLAPPTINSSDNNPIAQGMVNCFNGTGFGATQGTSTLAINGTAVTTTSWGDTAVCFTLPASTPPGAATGQVTTGLGASNVLSFTATGQPTISSLTPSSGTAGTQVTVTGTNFGVTKYSNNRSYIRWNGTDLPLVRWSDTQIVVEIPTGLTPGSASIVVVDNGLSASTSNFRVVGPLAITGLSPASAAVGMQVTISGSGFGTSQGDGQVLIGNQPMAVSSWNDTVVVVTVPSGAVSGGIMVTTGAGASSNVVNFVVTGFKAIGSLNIPRANHTATLLDNGAVLLAGGQDDTFNVQASGEIYNAATGTFVATGAMNTARQLHTATVLMNGKVLIAGGFDNSFKALVSAELYDPVTRTFSPTGGLSTARGLHTATLLNDGTVLIAGGQNGTAKALNSAEIYDPISATFTPAKGNLNTARNSQDATLLNNGQVLIGGGFGNNFGVVGRTELYDPIAGGFAYSGVPNSPRAADSFTLLNNGTTLFAGGFGTDFNNLLGAEGYDPVAGSFSGAGSLSIARNAQSSTRLNDGTALIAGGLDNAGNVLASAELYQPGSLSLPGLVSIALNPPSPTVPVSTSQGLVAIGTMSDGSTQTLTSVTWSSLDNTIATVSNDSGNHGHAFAVRAGSTTVSACAGAICVSAPITVSPSALVTLAITPGNSLLTTGSSVQLGATGIFSDGGTEDLTGLVTWSSTSPALVALNVTGLATGGALGSATVTAMFQGITATASLTVTPPLMSLAITPQHDYLGTGSTQQFTATGSYLDGSTRDLTSTVRWTSSLPSVATISNTGSAVGLTLGTTIISARLGMVSSSTDLNVNGSSLVSLAINSPSQALAVGGSEQFSATGTFADGGTGDFTNLAIWTSSTPAVASITARGETTGVSEGITIITASLSGFSSSTTLAVSSGPLVSLTITPQNPSVPLGLAQSLTATGTYSDGSTQDLTRKVNWSSSTPETATVSPAGLLVPVAQGPTTITASSGGVTASASVTITGPILLSGAITPQGAMVPPGGTQQLTASGRFSDGSTRDITTLVTWSSSQSSVAAIDANGLATAGSSGSSTISASLLGFIFSTNLTVTTPGPPVIVASIFPAPNDAGWNTSNVTVTFTCIPGSAAIVSCPPPQIVSTEGANQVIAGSVTDAVGNSAATSVTVNLDKTRPALAVAAPLEGDTFTNIATTVTGTLSDGLSGIASLTCNGAPVAFTGSDFNCNISLDPGLNLIVVSTTDVAGNITLTKLHVRLNVPLPQPTAVHISPARVNLAVGETQQFTVVDELGRPRADATWTIDDPVVASITTDGSPVLTAVAPGRVRITATVQGVSDGTQIDILSGTLAPGTERWRVQPLPGFRSVAVYPAVPSGEGIPGFYSFEQGSGNEAVRAFTSDGQQVWQQSPVSQNLPIPDASGGLIQIVSDGRVQAGNLILDLDGQTGKPIWQYSSPNTFDSFAVRPDGAVVAVESEPPIPFPFLGGSYIPHKFLDVFDGNTGQLTLQFPLPQTIDTHRELGDSCTPFNFEVRQAGAVSPVTIDGNGNIYLEYLSGNSTHTVTTVACGKILSIQTSDSSTVLLTISPDGSNSVQTLRSDTALSVAAGDQGPLPGDHIILAVVPGPGTLVSDSGSFTLPDHVIPDGLGGVLATWQELPNPNRQDGIVKPVMVTHLSPSGNGIYSLPINIAPQIVLGENGAAFAGDGVGTVVSFDMNSGQIFGTYHQAQIHTLTNIVAKTDDTGVLIADTNVDPNRVADNTNLVHLDSQATPTTIGFIAAPGPPVYTWTGQWFSPNSSTFELPVSPAIVGPWSAQAGNPSQQNRPPFRPAIADPCSGYDDAFEPVALVVPFAATAGQTRTDQESANSQRIVKIHHTEWRDINLASSDTAVFTVSPNHLTGLDTDVTITATGLPESATFTADGKAIATASRPRLLHFMSRTTQADFGQVLIDVKQRKTFSIAAYKVSNLKDGKDKLTPTSVPTQGDLQLELAHIFPAQTGVTLTVPNAVSPLSVHYDLDNSGAMQFPDPSESNTTNEQAQIVQAVLSNLVPNQLLVFYVHAFDQIPARFGRPDGITSRSKLVSAAGNPSQNGPSVIRDPAVSTVPNTIIFHNSRQNVTAHELGHYLGSADVNDPNRMSELMYGTANAQNPNPCRIRRSEWDLMNPPGSK